MEAFLISLSTVAIAEMGDRTQFLSLVLAARFQKPVPVIAGIFVATIADHLAAGVVGVQIGRHISPAFLDGLVGCSMMAMALWTFFFPDKHGEGGETSSRGAFVTTLVTFFVAEIGDKTQIATLALAAAYANLFLVVAGSTLGMMIANVPVVILGKLFANRLPLTAIRFAASALFFVLGAYFVIKASAYCWPPLSSLCY
jgi:putative Ca2+/H+ antiporter (TMEM165/GDT1 family)